LNNVDNSSKEYSGNEFTSVALKDENTVYVNKVQGDCLYFTQ